MKTPYIILYIILMLLLSSFVSSTDVLTTDPDLIGYWKFDEAGATMKDYKDNGKTEFGLSYNGALQQQTAIAPYSTNSLGFDNANDVCINNSAKMQLVLENMKDYTVSCWVNSNNASDDGIMGTRTAGAAGWYLGVTSDNGGHLRYVANTDVGEDVFHGVSGSMFTMVFNQSAGVAYLYLNTTRIVYGDSDGSVGEDIDQLQIGSSGTSIWFDGELDECFILNRTLEQVDIDDVFANGILSSVIGTPKAPSITSPSPGDNSHNNTNVTLNVTHETPSNDVRYYLYFGTSSALDAGDLIYNNVTRNASEYSYWYTNVGDGTYYWKWQVQNITDGAFSSNTTQRTLIIDTVTPTITLLENMTFETDNSTVISSYINDFSFNVSFFDTYLYQIMVNITNSTGGYVWNKTNTSIGGKTSVNLSANLDISNWAIGNYTIKFIATDSHTATSIKPYDVNTGLSYFRYTTDEGNVIKIGSDTIPLTKRTDKLKDRYTFEFNYLTQKDTYKFTIESYNKIDYLVDSEYKAHFVIIGSDGKGNWIDFENPYLNRKDYKVTKIDDYTYEVEITANGIKEFTFNSLGGLNRIEKDYLFKLGSVLDVWVFDGDNYPTQLNATATIGTQSANTTTNVSGARLVNITKETTKLDLTSSGYGTEEKTFVLTNSYHNLSFNMSPTEAVKIYFYDEESGTLISGETFSVYLETTGFSNTYSSITANPYTITGLSSGLYDLKASSANYPERQFFNLNITNATTTVLNIYLINNTDGAEKTFYVRGSSVNAIEDVYINFTRVIGGSRVTIAEEYTDYDGAATLYLDENYEYRIIFSKDGYETKTMDLEPVRDEYIVTLTLSTGQYNVSVYEGIRYSFEPSDTILNNNTKYNFSFTLNSSVWEVTNCNFTLKNGSRVLGTTSGYKSNSCYLRIELNTANMTNITSAAVYELNSLYAFPLSQQYSIIDTYEGQFSLKNFLDDISDLGMAGFDSFGRMALAFIAIFSILAWVGIKTDFGNREALILVFWALVGFFSYIGWFTLGFDNMPNILGLKKWFIFYLVSLVCGAFIWDKWRK